MNGSSVGQLSPKWGIQVNPTMFTVMPEQLEALDATRAVMLVANLLWAEVRTIGLSTTRVNISTRINVADAGVDASVDMSDLHDVRGTFIAQGRSALQIKAGASFKPWQESQIKDELFGDKLPSREALGDSVRACLDANGTFILVCTGTDPNEKEAPSAKEHLKNCFVLCGYQDAKVEVWGQNTLIGLLQIFPSLALEVNGSINAHFYPRSNWSKQTEMLRPFRLGAKQQDFINSLQEAIRWADRPVHVHIRGEAGIGKTRLVLETSVADDIGPLVLYCDVPAAVLEGGLMPLLVREGIKRSTILVVDECDLDKRAQIWNQLQYHSPRIRLISIYNDLEAPAGTTSVMDAPPLDEAQVVEIIEGYGAPKDEAQRCVEFCDGSPRVAHVIGQNLKNNPEDMLRRPDTVNVWDRYVAGADDLNSHEVQQRRTTLQFIALFRRFGYGPPLGAEAKIIAELIEKANPQITWYRFQEIVKCLRERKILQGETTLYITPRLLHIKLWSDWWDTYGEGFDVLRFAEDGTAPGESAQLAHWFREMFQYAAQSKAALKITKELLDEKGRFGDLGFFETMHGASFFLALTNAAPEAALKYLHRTIGTWDSQRLAKFKRGRREAVWSLEKIAVWRPLFLGAARLLLRLAEAENENFANNSTGVFADLFSLGQGPVAPTEAPPEERFPVLKDALESSSKQQREVALKACDHALRTSYISRMAGAEYQGLRRPPKLWRAGTWGELFDAYRRGWYLVVDRLPKFEADEFEKAVNVLTTHVRGLSRFANLGEMVLDTMSDLAERFPYSRGKVIEVVEMVVRYEAKALSPENFQLWEALRTRLVETSFHSQMERYVGMDLLQDGFDENGNAIDTAGPKILALARQANETPELLSSELPWLVTEKAKNGYRFGRQLGVLDTEFALLDGLLKAQRDLGTAGNPFFLGGYLSVLFERNRELWEDILDQLAQDGELRGLLPELTWRSGMTERAALRILSMAQAGLMPLSSLRMFAFGGVVRKIPEHVFAKWVDCLLGAGTRIAAWTALDLFHFYYLMGPEKRHLPRELTLRLLTAEPFFKKSDSTDLQTEDFDWTQVAKAFLDQYPQEGLALAESIFGSLGSEGTIADKFRSDTLNVLTTVAETLPAESWKLVVQYLGPPVDSRAFHISRWLRDGGLTLMPPGKVWEWIESDVPTRSWYAATFVPPNFDRTPGKVSWARELLVRYGDRKEVRHNLYANFSNASWWGSETSYYQSKKQMLESMHKSETDANVLLWLGEFIESLTFRIENARIREERGL